MFDSSITPPPPEGDEGWEQVDVVVPLGRADAVRRLAVAVGGLDALIGLDAGADGDGAAEDGGGAVAHEGDVDGGGVPADGSGVDGGALAEGGRDPMAWVWSPAVGTPDAFVLAGLAQVDVSLLTEPELVAHVARLHQVQAYVESLQVGALAALAGVQEQASVVPLPGKGSLVVADVIREEVAAALGVGHGAAQGRIDTARALWRYLPGTRAALARGRSRGCTRG